MRTFKSILSSVTISAIAVLTSTCTFVEQTTLPKLAGTPHQPDSGTLLVHCGALIEMHSHILESYEELVDLTLYYGYSHEDYMEAGRKYSHLSLAAGVTTVRSLVAYYGWADKDLRDEINRGETIGPRLQAAGYYLTIPGGGGDLLEPGGDEDAIRTHLRMGVSRSPDEFRRHAQSLVDGGADVLKVIASGAVLAYGGGSW